MPSRTLGDLFMGVRAQVGADFKRDVVKAAGAAGDAGGKEMATRMGTSMKKGMTAAGSVIGAALSGAMSVALIGRFAALERAQADFRKETGATAAEAERAGKAINDMAGRNLQSVEEIGLTLTKVHTDLGLTGDEAERVTEQFLRFGRATGQDASEAVLAFDDILDSWNLTAADAQGLMDKLVLAHQRYGGSIEDNQATLAALAPSMRAANLEIDDGIALLDLFGAKGIDANTASAAFAKSLTKVRSPEELQQLITDISNTEDPFKRAEKAADLFGARAGAKLANALAGANLDDYKVSLEDAAGATDRAADASLTLADRAKQALAGFISEAVDLLGPAGPLLTAVGSLGSLFAPLLGKAFSGAVGLGKVAIAEAGALAGAIFAGSEATGTGILGALKNVLTTQLPRVLAALGPLAFVGVALTPRDPEGHEHELLDAGLKKLADAQAIRDARAGGWTIGEAVGAGVGDGATSSLSTFWGDFGDILTAGVGPVAKEVGHTTGTITDAMGNELVRTTETMGDRFVDTFRYMAREASTLTRSFDTSLSALRGIVKGTLREARDEAEKRMADIAWSLKHPMQGARLEAFYEDQISAGTRAMNKALKSGNDEAYAKAKAFVDDYKAKLEELRNEEFHVKVTADFVTKQGGIPGLGAYAEGGPARAGVPIIVGDGGRPEVFVPDVAGRIVPSLAEFLRLGALKSGMSDLALAPLSVPSSSWSRYAGDDALGSGDVHVYIHDEDGGMARAGMTEDGVARIVESRLRGVLTAAVDSAHIGYMRPKNA